MPGDVLPIQSGGNRVTIGRPAVIEIRPRVHRVRLTGMLFDTDKCFLLSGALAGIRAFKKIWSAHPDCKVLIVGHADRAGNPGHNRSLSLERARAIEEFLKDDVDRWLAFYSPGRPPTKNWGAAEDAEMVAALGFATVQDFQSARGLEADGIAGPDTRRMLVTEYIAQDETSLPPTASTVTHGCGEAHPEVPTPDGERHQANRRVEIFLLEEAVDPPPVTPCPSGGCKEQPVWAAASTETTVDLGDDPGTVVVAVTDQSGAPVPDADIHLSGFVPEDARTGADGTVRVVDVIPLHYEVFARKEGFESASAEIDVPAGGEAPVALTLKAAAGTLDVRVRDPDNTFISGAQVDATGPGVPAESKATDASGKALFFPAKPGGWTIAVRADGFVNGSASDAVQPDGTTTTLVTLEPAVGALLVQVLVDGAPVAGATVEAAGPIAAGGTTDGEGRLLLAALRVGGYAVTARKAGIAGTASATALVQLGQQATATLVLATGWAAAWSSTSDGFARMGRTAQMTLTAPGLEDGQTVAFEVTQVGLGVVGSVNATSSGGTASASWDDWFDFDRVTAKKTLAAGQAFPAVQFTFRAVAAGVPVLAAAPLPYEDFLTGRLLDATGEPLANVDYLLYSPWGIRPARSGADGAIDGRGLPPGGITLVATERGMGVSAA